MEKKYGFLMRTLFTLAAILAALFNITGLNAEDRIDSKGKDFWLTYLPNYHNYFYETDNKFKLGDSLYIFITSEKPTSGLIEYTDRNGLGHTQNFTITNPSEVYTFKVCYRDYELFGYNLSGQINSVSSTNRYQSETICNMSFHVTSQDDITVYAHSQAVTTSEAFLVIPTDALGNEHIVVAYNTDGGWNTGIDYQSTPSEFAIVSAEDNNEVTIKPSCPTYYNQMITQSITLQKGQVYLVQADVSASNQQYDLTGTKINSTKPLALFCGHQRSTIPVVNNNSYSSRDILIEQIPPVVTWGQNAFLVPYKQPSNVSSQYSDLYRIMSGSDANAVRIDGAVVATLNKGQFYENKLINPGVVTADGPILVVQYKKTSSFMSSNYLGDPFIMVMPPKEQFSNSYRVINLQAYQYNSSFYDYEKVYDEQYITAIVPNNAVSSFKLDNTGVASSQFMTIGSSGYSYVHLPVSDGVHEMTCNYGFGVFIYGYGYANSYGYVGGMSFTRLDMPPVVMVTDSCFSVAGSITDSSASESGINEIDAPADKKENVVVAIDNFNKPAKAVNFSAYLVDKYKDGKFTVNAKDTAGNTTIKDITIPGFTVCHPYTVTTDTIPVYRPQLTTGTKFCFKIPVYNYGAYQQAIKALKVKNTAITINYTTPNDIQPKETDSVEICILTTNSDGIIDTLYLSGPCGTRPIAIINTGNTDCDETMYVYDDFSDDRFIEYNGNAKRALDRIRLTPSAVNSNGSFWRKLMMPLRNGFVTEFAFSMSNGYNHTGTEHSLPGADGIAFVIQNEGLGVLGNYGGGIGYDAIKNSVAVEFDMFRNDSTQLFDYYDPNGNHVAVQSMKGEPNSAKHTKQATLGITDTIMSIKPNGMTYYARIEYNLTPGVLSVYLNNSRKFTVPVLEIKNFKLENYISFDRQEFAYVGFTAATANSYEVHEILSWYFCPKPTNGIQTEVDEAVTVNSGDLLLYPNPVDDFLNVSLGGNVGSIVIYDLMGEEVKTMAAEGNARIDVSGLSRGCYVVRVKYTNGQLFSGSFIKK